MTLIKNIQKYLFTKNIQNKFNYFETITIKPSIMYRDEFIYKLKYIKRPRYPSLLSKSLENILNNFVIEESNRNIEKLNIGNFYGMNRPTRPYEHQSLEDFSNAEPPTKIHNSWELSISLKHINEQTPICVSYQDWNHKYFYANSGGNRSFALLYKKYKNNEIPEFELECKVITHKINKDNLINLINNYYIVMIKKDCSNKNILNDLLRKYNIDHYYYTIQDDISKPTTNQCGIYIDKFFSVYLLNRNNQLSKILYDELLNKQCFSLNDYFQTEFINK